MSNSNYGPITTLTPEPLEPIERHPAIDQAMELARMMKPDADGRDSLLHVAARVWMLGTGIFQIADDRLTQEREEQRG